MKTRKKQKYSRTAAREFPPFQAYKMFIVSIKSVCMKHYKILPSMCCNVLAGEHGPSCFCMKQIPEFKITCASSEELKHHKGNLTQHQVKIILRDDRENKHFNSFGKLWHGENGLVIFLIFRSNPQSTPCPRFLRLKKFNLTWDLSLWHAPLPMSWKGLRAAGLWPKLEKLDSRQYAREGHSTTDALIYILQVIHEVTDSGNCGTRLFFMDYSKGFDLIDH